MYIFRHFIKEMSSLIIKNDIRNPVLYNLKLIQEVEECEVLVRSCGSKREFFVDIRNVTGKL